MKAKKAQKKIPLGSQAEYMRQYRLRQNDDVYSRVSIKVKNYLTVKQAEKIEAEIDKVIGLK